MTSSFYMDYLVNLSTRFVCRAWRIVMDRWLPPDSAPGLAREKQTHSLLYPDAYAFVNAVCSGERPCPMPGPCQVSLASATTSGSNCIRWLRVLRRARYTAPALATTCTGVSPPVAARTSTPC